MKFFQVDAFTDRIFSGNPAGVCILPENEINDDILLRNIAAEINASETAFLCGDNGEYRLRWFTPETEVKLCGHGTLSAAHILWETGKEKKSGSITFTTLSGRLFARYVQGQVELDFPAYDTVAIEKQKEINQALDITPKYSGQANDFYLFEIDNFESLVKTQPDFEKLKAYSADKFIIVTCKSANAEYDFYSRFFAPSFGVNEDPVTGSAHSYLTPYWSKKLHKTRLKAYQASLRGGILECELPGNGRVLIRGKAITVFDINTKYI